MPKITFTDNNAILNNPDRGQIMETRFLYSPIAQSFYSAWDETYGDLEMMWFDAPIYIHELGRTIKWMRNGVVIGQGIVHGWDHEFNVILKDVTGEYAEPGDLLINHDINTFNYISDFITWKELEPTEGVYDWAFADERFKKAFCEANNKKIIISFAMDYPTLVDHRDIPDWLYTQMGGAGVAGAVYEFEEVGNTKRGFSPDYTNPLLIAKHALVMAALKNHFGNLIEMMEIGSLGHWGEFHTWPQTTGIGSMPPNSVSAQYIQHYLDNFDHTQLGIRRPVDKATDEGIGLYFQMMGGSEHLYNAEWGLLTTANNGYIDPYGNVQKPYPNFKAMSPVGGEHDPYVDNEKWEADFSDASTGRNYVRTVQMSRDLELSRLRSHPEVHLGRIDGVPVKANVEDFSRRIGYRFVLKEFEYTVNGSNLDVIVKIENKGFARCYKSYPVYVSFFDSNNNFIGKQNLNIDLKTVLRETTQTFTRSIQYPTANKIAFQIEGINIPITTPIIGDGNYFIANQNLTGVVADIPVGIYKYVKGNGTLESIPVYSTTAVNLEGDELRTVLDDGTIVLFDLVATNNPSASSIRVHTSSGTKSIKKIGG